ncbi:hypothetical protein CD131_01550 [Staphylococcus muscae]|nr:hypothetical protein CD131_01550 [Staphylococcus muscae]
MILTLLSYIMIYKDTYIHIALLIAVLIEVLLIVLLSIFIAVIVHFFVLRYARNSHGYSKYALITMYMMISVIAIILVTMSTLQIISNYKDYQKQIVSLKHWDITQNIYTTNMYEVGQVKNRSIDKAISVKTKNYFLSSDSQGFIVDMENFYFDGNYFLYQLNAKENADIESNGKTIVIDMHYLKRHPIKTNQGDNVMRYMQKEDKTLNILVPIKLKRYEQKIKTNFREYFTFKKILNTGVKA